MCFISEEDYSSHASMLDNVDHAMLGACELDDSGSADEDNEAVQQSLSLGLTEPIPLHHESPATALMNQLGRSHLRRRNTDNGNLRSSTRKRPFSSCTGILTVAISYAHYEDNSSNKLSQEQAEKSIKLAWEIAQAQPHEIKAVRFWIDQMIPQEELQTQTHDEFIAMSLLPFYKLPVVSVAKESSIRRSTRLMIENTIISKSSINFTTKEDKLPRICPFPAAFDSAEYDVASMIIAGLFDGVDYSTLDDEEVKPSDILRWACKLFCQSKQMKKIYKINANIDDKAGYGFFMGADWWWCSVGKNSCRSRDQRRYHNQSNLSDASMVGMSTRAFSLLSSQEQDDFQTFLAAFSHYTPSSMMEHQYYGTTFPMSYIWVNLSCDSTGPYLNMEHIQLENAVCPVRNANFSIGSKKLGLMRQRRRICNNNSTESPYIKQLFLMEKEKLLSSDYLKSFEKILQVQRPVNVMS